VSHRQLTCAAASARAALEKQVQAEKSAADAKKRAAEALAGRADAQRALDNVAKCVGFRVWGCRVQGPTSGRRLIMSPSASA
jgi:4'-phosphopantetheinyl transferase EntD